MSTLCDAAVLACDLARTPTGADVADVLLQAFAFAPRPGAPAPALDLELERLRGVVRALDAVRPEAAVMAETVARLAEHCALVEGQTPRSVEALRDGGRALTGIRLLSLHDIGAMLVLEVLADDPAAALAAADAVSARVLQPALGAAQVARLTQRWDALVGPLPGTADLTGLGRPDLLRDLFEQLQTCDAGTWDRVLQAYRGGRRDGVMDWAPLMHEACVAVHSAGLTRPVAAAQVSAARAVLANPSLAAADRASVMPAVTARVQGLAAEGVAPAAVCGRLGWSWTSSTSA